MEAANWMWGLLLTALTIGIHAVGVVLSALAFAGIRRRLADRHLPPRRAIPILISLVSAAGLLLAVLHGLEAGIWAAAYIWLGAIASPSEAILYSIDSMSTRGASGVALEAHWRMMGALESVNGMLLFGISTAYIFTILQTSWRILARQRR
ncbi:MAG: hypothetical protein IPK81_20285 [Rhodospirillales bacterium]|nr:MAG: hypothetical protein IPK81_20285 [Rhodospirillales bacterium]